MNERKALLFLILKTVRTGKYRIGILLEHRMLPGFRKTLASQLHELDTIETEAQRMAFRRGWDLTDPDFMTLFWLRQCIRFRSLGRKNESFFAALLIREHTCRSIRILTALHRLRQEDPSLRILCQKLLDCQTAAIRLLQSHL